MTVAVTTTTTVVARETWRPTTVTGTTAFTGQFGDETRRDTGKPDGKLPSADHHYDRVFADVNRTGVRVRGRKG